MVPHQQIQPVLLILLKVSVVLLFTLIALFAEPRVGKARAEVGTRSLRDCRHAYSLLAGTAAIAADRLYSLLSSLTQQTQP